MGGHYKSYGVFGTSTTYSPTVLATAAEMSSGGYTPKYMTISLWPNDFEAAEQGSRKLVLEFGRKDFGSTSTWQAPTAPSSSFTAIVGAKYLAIPYALISFYLYQFEF